MNARTVCVDSFLSSEEDARAIEDAIKAAVKAVVCVLCNINDNRMRAYETAVIQKDNENDRLRLQLESAERELTALRRFTRAMGMGHGGHVDTACSLDSGLSSEENSKQSLCVKTGLGDGEEDTYSPPAWSEEFAGQARETDQAEHRRWEAALDAPLVHLSEGLHRQGHGETAAVSPLKSDDDARRPAIATGNASSTPLPVKEEPGNFDSVCIKWEVCDQSFGEEGGVHPPPACDAAFTWPGDGAPPCGGSPNNSFGFSIQPGERTAFSGACQKLAMSNREKLQRYRARIRADPEKYRAYREMDRRRYQMRKKSIKDLPEQCQRLKREAWREASRRHRARKKSCPPIGPHTNLTLNMATPLDSSGIFQNWD